jgi:endonuclease YncB( thermonuclease family)
VKSVANIPIPSASAGATIDPVTRAARIVVPGPLHRAAGGLLVALVMAFAGAPARAADLNLSGRIVGVMDGDTVALLTDANVRVRIRLVEIDAPEKSQPWGMNAKKALSNLVFQKEVVVLDRGLDSYGRTLGRIYVGPVDVSAAMVRSGSAWADQQHLIDPSFVALEETARRARLGLWSLPASQTIPPWQWRHDRSSRQSLRAAIQQPLPPRPGTAAPSGCGSKRYCREMTSCEEARFYLNQCGVVSLDGDGDGVPCERLCRISGRR